MEAKIRFATDPNLFEGAVEKMLIQHLLTERIFRRVFHAEEFRNRNLIASEIEKVIQSMTSRHFSCDQFLGELDRFYKAIEARSRRQRRLQRKAGLPHTFEHELHCNEIMLLPYYIASMNIEHEYMEQTGQYKPFDGSLVDTFELAEPEQATLAFMTEENTARIKKQKCRRSLS